MTKLCLLENSCTSFLFQGDRLNHQDVICGKVITNTVTTYLPDEQVHSLLIFSSSTPQSPYLISQSPNTDASTSRCLLRLASPLRVSGSAGRPGRLHACEHTALPHGAPSLPYLSGNSPLLVQGLVQGSPPL